MQAIISTLNQQGGNHLVLSHPKHKALFERYKHYFQQGITKLAIKQSNTIKNDAIKNGTIIIALTDINGDDITNMHASAINTTG
ncbi:hypothetical protein L3081_20340 [Colwellia sp. MSW7]|uniref:Uncharacterized protein n=1 Tax=Colwellia maritima TaxID=2912588 RepID=A0ABS9X5D4_9GAMM|nr:hypothetical protein [Colwellia maritima]MCI2285300.1 hypothetical protein [Colwellia maritima]